MAFYIVEPEIAGTLGPRTVLNRDTHPPKLHKLHYQFDGWLGDVLVESFPAFIVTEPAKTALIEMTASGLAFGEVEVTTSSVFQDLYPNRTLPSFVWLKPYGQAGQDDVAIVEDGRLILSRPVITLLQKLGLRHALLTPFAD